METIEHPVMEAYLSLIVTEMLRSATEHVVILKNTSLLPTVHQGQRAVWFSAFHSWSLFINLARIQFLFVDAGKPIMHVSGTGKCVFACLQLRS